MQTNKSFQMILSNLIITLISHMNPIAKKKSHNLLDSGFYYTAQHFIPPYRKGEKCKCKYSNEYSDADPIEKKWYKKIPLLTPMHVQYVSIYYHPTKGKCKCHCKKYSTGEEHLIVIYKDTQLFTVKTPFGFAH